MGTISNRLQELSYYLLQLVQSLRYETAEHDSKLSDLLIEKALHDVRLRTFLFWYGRNIAEITVDLGI